MDKMANRVFVSWEEQWEISRYIERYLSTRRISATPVVRKRLIGLLQSYKGQTPLTKSDLDYYLDANLWR